MDRTDIVLSKHDDKTFETTLISVCAVALLVVSVAGCSSSPSPLTPTSVPPATPAQGASTTPPTPTPSRGTQTIVCIGDSIVRKWPSVLEQRLGGGWRVIEKRGDADTTDQMLARFDADVIAYHPTFVIILAGTAHLEPGVGPKAVEPNIAKMCERARANGIKPVMCTIPPDNEAGVSIAWVNELNTWVQSYARSQGYDVIDFYALLNDPLYPGHMLTTYSSGDGIHPNDAGYRAMGAYVPLRIFGVS
jgi:lysophospholipase L1-like esterase